MTAPTMTGFFAGGAKGVTWPDQPGLNGGRVQVSGQIAQIHPPEESLDPKDDSPTGKFQVRIVLQTDERDPSVPDDDGRRTLYVKSYMRGAVGDAVRKAGADQPQEGGKLTVIFTHVIPPDRPGLSPSKRFTAIYEKPTASTAGFFGNGSNSAAPAQRPAAIPEATWNAMDPASQAAVSASMGGGSAPVLSTATGAPVVHQQQIPTPPPPAPAQPAYTPPPAAQPAYMPPPAAPAIPMPPGFDPASWAAMDAATQQAVATTMGVIPVAAVTPPVPNQRPAMIPEAAWNAMSPVAQAELVKQLPPF